MTVNFSIIYIGIVSHKKLLIFSIMENFRHIENLMYVLLRAFVGCCHKDVYCIYWGKNTLVSGIGNLTFLHYSF
jgi:hypothetical protein